MSAPKTNIETQKRRHIGPLIGMALVAVFGVGLIVYWQVEEAAMGDSPTADSPVETPVTHEVDGTAPEPSTDADSTTSPTQSDQGG